MNEIPYDLAFAAHSGTSWSPESRAQSEQVRFSDEMSAVKSDLEQLARNDEERTIVDEFMPRFRQIMGRLYREYLQSRSNVVSWAIAGPSNFPARRMEKRARWAHNKLEHYLAVKEKLLKRVRKQLRPEYRPIMSGDDNAIERLEYKIKDAERWQEMMKSGNKVVRKYVKKDHEAGIKALIEIGFCEALARKSFKPDCFGGYGFAGFELSNNNANIRRMKQRLEQIKRAKATPETTIEREDGIRIEDVPADNRVRIFFPGKPDAEVRTRLKSSGFRWAPSLECWQAYRNDRTMATARQFV